MNQLTTKPKILLVDDEEVVRDSIREILAVKEPTSTDTDLQIAGGDLFDDWEPVAQSNPRRYHPDFRIEEASNGKAGLARVQQAIDEGDPYAVIFLDMRMPGWDGLTTCTEIRKIDPKAQVFFVTAFSDRSLDEIVAEAGADVGYISKPFSPEEILQLATKAVYDWQRLSNLEYLLKVVSQIGIDKTHLQTLLRNLLHQIAEYLHSDFAILGKFEAGEQFVETFRIGIGENRIDIPALTSRIEWKETEQVELVEGVVVCRMENYCVFAIQPPGTVFNQEKTYLLKLFLQNAVRTIQNATLNQQLVQQEKLSAVGQAMSMVMHDIKTPIAQIQSLIGFIQEDFKIEPEALDMTEMIMEASEHAMDIISDMRDFVQNTEFPTERINFSTFLEKVGQDLQPILSQAGIELSVSVPENLPLDADPRKLRRVLVNLVNNASEALQDKHIQPAKIALRAEVEGEAIHVQVADNGPGIPPAIMKKLFDPFVTSGKATGTGLGLAIVKQVVEGHGGSIQVESSPEGACFHLRFPMPI